MGSDLGYDATHKAVRQTMAIGPLVALLLGCTSTRSEIQSRGTVAIPAPPRPPVGQQLSPGVSHTTVEGCLAVQGESEATRFPSPPVTRSGPPPPVTVAAVPGGLLITHQLAHACCLQSKVSTRIEQRNVVVLETLSGTPCRCMCSSTLRTSAGLAPGRWNVAVDLDTGRRVERVFTGTVVVGSP